MPWESRIWNRIPYFGISRCALNKRSNIRFRRVLNKRSSAQPRLGIIGVDIKKEFTSHHIFWPFSGVKQRRWKAWKYWVSRAVIKNHSMNLRHSVVCCHTSICTEIYMYIKSYAIKMAVSKVVLLLCSSFLLHRMLIKGLNSFWYFKLGRL